MRFKCVCKKWQSIIKDDRYFIDLYNTRSKLRPCLVLFIPIHRKFNITPGSTYTLYRRFQANLLIADLCEGVAEEAATTPHNVWKTTSIKFDKVIHKERVGYDGIFKSVNGLICFTDTTWEFGVRIYNIATRELTPWMSTTFIQKEERVVPEFDFGFDPATKQHKVICFWKIERNYGRKDSYPVYAGCEVLTLGDNTWRIINIDEFPQHEHEHDSYFSTYGFVYVNGYIYWTTRRLVYGCRPEKRVIVAFDVGSEKFKIILVPKFITDQLLSLHDTEYIDFFNSSKDLLEVNDRVALFCRVPGGHTVKLWILDCDHTSSCSQNWTETTIDLPFQGDNKRVVVFHGIPGTDEIIIETYEDSRSIKGLSLTSYNWKSMTSRKVESAELNHFNSPKKPSERGVFMCSTMTESLFSVYKK
ncbi:putative F-box protein At1g32420 [Papaver somniferum]|nr:putative F-box protein At1g32420 [Papaver somniferum]